jgi:hypothetical protein
MHVVWWRRATINYTQPHRESGFDGITDVLPLRGLGLYLCRFFPVVWGPTVAVPFALRYNFCWVLYFFYIRGLADSTVGQRRIAFLESR